MLTFISVNCCVQATVRYLKKGLFHVGSIIYLFIYLFAVFIYLFNRAELGHAAIASTERNPRLAMPKLVSLETMTQPVYIHLSTNHPSSSWRSAIAATTCRNKTKQQCSVVSDGNKQAIRWRLLYETHQQATNAIQSRDATAHSPTLPSLYLRHSSFSNPSVASPTSQLILLPSFTSSTSQALHLRHLASHPWPIGYTFFNFLTN